MSRLTDLIAKAKATDPLLGTDLEREFRALSSRLSFGLNFERHRPEAVELPQCPIRRGDKVRVLPERGSTAKGDQRLWHVKAIDKVKKSADLELLDAKESEVQTVALDDLVVVAEFRDTIYPGLVSTGKVVRGGDKPWHTVISGENYHALKALTWTHRGRVDAIYIDPPYNTGARDWKYNNNYVESDDLYRHSKWLAMMERRLQVAGELLNPRNSVLIVTIDEKEYMRLGMLLEQLFPEAQLQMVSSVIAPQGSTRGSQFKRSDEYIYFLFFGASSVTPLRLGAEWANGQETKTVRGAIHWASLKRTGTEATRRDRPQMFYPVFISDDCSQFHSVGEPLPLEANRKETPIPENCLAVWPIRRDGSEGRWQVGPSALRKLISKGHARLGRPAGSSTAIAYLKAGERKKVQRGEYKVLETRVDGSIVTDHEKGTASQAEYRPTTVWNLASHSAGHHGSNLLRALLPGRSFPFPKSLYAVEDALRFFVTDNPEAVILDFFAGSGTTAQAVMRLNKQDGGRRQSISVTNNEVGSDEHKALQKKWLRPGDEEWEKWGICEYITKPRIETSITGKTPEGKPVKGEYKFTDEFPMADGFAENAEFFTLTYESPVAVNYQTAFVRIAPLLWLRAGSEGRRIDELPANGWEVADTYGLLVELDEAASFLTAVRDHGSLRIAYVVTDDERRFQAIARQLPDDVGAIRLYESYLTNFAFANGDEA
ncbi:MAG: site-specific DNA-methyltransferase [Acidobacteria bacterium]|mgnify:CR=1 FL=1|nr:MAG: site-specific DNA-methyltransferase [Acidobacteriota bacterium]REK01674.1 MAG: site-specific DNA-methyltransferase [Acidobacteriota bacterium]REK14630.1 MAG: site-specific DNA-methyltransferase [Acidobacteriota bacterium]REK45345.1 MAG: site-specific DNA-methyltransferase [Acidobacteriota bacterium]